jgi:ATP adenylyltransferase
MVHAKMTHIYGPIVAFEHGPAQTGRLAGCGVDHAHLHLVPWSKSFKETVETNSSANFHWQKADAPDLLSNFFHAGKDYLFFEEAAGKWATASCDIPSQFFRRVLATAIGKPAAYDWKQNDGENNVLATIAALCGTPSLAPLAYS